MLIKIQLYCIINQKFNFKILKNQQGLYALFFNNKEHIHHTIPHIKINSHLV